MKYVIIQPTAVHTLDKLPPRIKTSEVEVGSCKFMEIEKYHVWYDSRKQKPVYDSEQDKNQYWMIFGDVCVYAASAYDLEDLQKRMSSLTEESLQEFIQSKKEVLENPDKYLSEQKKEREERQAERQREDAEREEKRKQREEIARIEFEKTLDVALEDFKNKKQIDSTAFENLCDRYGVKMHMRTVGSLRKRVGYIGVDSGCSHGTGGIPDGVWLAAKELFDKVTTTEEIIDPEIERLFGKV